MGDASDGSVLSKVLAGFQEDMAALRQEFMACVSTAERKGVSRATKNVGSSRSSKGSSKCSREWADADDEFMRALERQAIHNNARRRQMLGNVTEDVSMDPNPSAASTSGLEVGDDGSQAKGFGSPQSSSGSGSTLDVVETTVSAENEAANKSEKEKKLLSMLKKVETGAVSEGLRAAKAYEDVGFYYCNEQNRPWKSVQFLLEAWRRYKLLQDDLLEAEFLSPAATCLAKAGQTEEAIAMANRRYELLREVDPTSANESQKYLLHLKERLLQQPKVH